MHFIIFSLIFYSNGKYINFDSKPKVFELVFKEFFLIDSRYGATVVKPKGYPKILNDPSVVELKNQGKDYYKIKFLKNGKYLCKKQHGIRLTLCNKHTDKYTKFYIKKHSKGYQIKFKEGRCVRTAGPVKGTKLETYHLEIDKCLDNYHIFWPIKNFEDIAPKKPEPIESDSSDDKCQTEKDSDKSSESDSSTKNSESSESESSEKQTRKKISIPTSKYLTKKAHAMNKSLESHNKPNKIIPRIKKAHHPHKKSKISSSFSDSSSSSDHKNASTKNIPHLSDKHSLKGHHNFTHTDLRPYTAYNRFPSKIPFNVTKKLTNTITEEITQTINSGNITEQKKVTESKVIHPGERIQSFFGGMTNSILNTTSDGPFTRNSTLNVPERVLPFNEAQSTVSLPAGEQLLSNDSQSIQIPLDNVLSNNDKATVNIPPNSILNNNGQSIKIPSGSILTNHQNTLNIPPNSILTSNHPIRIASGGTLTTNSQSTDIPPGSILSHDAKTISTPPDHTNTSQLIDVPSGSILTNETNSDTADNTSSQPYNTRINELPNTNESNFIQLDPDCTKSKHTDCQYASCLNSTQIQDLLLNFYRRTLCMHSVGKYRGRVEPCYCVD